MLQKDQSPHQGKISALATRRLQVITQAWFYYFKRLEAGLERMKNQMVPGDREVAKPTPVK